MFGIEIKFPDGHRQRCHSRDNVLLIGKDPGCKIALSGWRVSKRHAELFVSHGQVFVRDLRTAAGTFVNGRRVGDTAGPLHFDDVIGVANYQIRAFWRRREEPYLPVLVPSSFAGVPGRALPANASHMPGTTHAPLPSADPPKPLVEAAEPVPPADWMHWRQHLHDQLLDAFGTRRTDVHRMADDELRALTERILADLIEHLPGLPPQLDRARLMAEVRDEAIGLGLLEPLLADAEVTEIMVNAADEVFVERAGRLQRVPLAFTSGRTVLGIIERIVAPLGRRIDESSPMVDARLKDGSRVHAVIPPLALKGPTLTIRKFAKRQLVADDLLRFGSASHAMIEFLRVCVAQRKNIVISGGTGSGKTTLLNILSHFIPQAERVVTIEDAAELQLPHPNLVALEARPANLEGRGRVTIRDLVRNALRMRPDRIVVGECRGEEALDMLQAMNTGHDGSLTTAHANSPRDMLSRLEVMVLMAGMELPVAAIREQVASAVQVIVQQSRLPCGARRITSIVEVTGMESGRIQLQELFAHVQDGLTPEGHTRGHFTGRGLVPEFYEALAQRGVALDMGIFAATEANAAPADVDTARRAGRGTADAGPASTTAAAAVAPAAAVPLTLSAQARPHAASNEPGTAALLTSDRPDRPAEGVTIARRGGA